MDVGSRGCLQAQAALAGKGIGFDAVVPRDGYRWWYLDAFSDDGNSALTIIVFIGSVFSPYYFRARRANRGDPENFCSVNAILYGPDRRRWAMTERGRADLDRDATFISIGSSRVLDHDNGKLVFQVDEVCNPLPTRLVGQVEVQTGPLGEQCFNLDPQSQHRWWPAAPAAQVSLNFTRPNLQWQGRGYLDSNAGVVPLEDTFSDWHWQRSELSGDGGHIHYDACLLDGNPQSLALHFNEQNLTRPMTTDALPGPVAATPIWRAGRQCRQIGTHSAVEQTLEESPFYARSVLNVDTGLGQQRVMHESLHLNRFRAPWMQWMLPVRMPRRTLNHA